MDTRRRNKRSSNTEPARIGDMEQSPTSDTGTSEINSGSYGERVAHRAYQRYEERGRDHGRDQEDWFEAERELMSGKNRE